MKTESKKIDSSLVESKFGANSKEMLCAKYVNQGMTFAMAESKSGVAHGTASQLKESANLTEGEMPKLDQDVVHRIMANAMAVAIKEIELTSGVTFASASDAVKFAKKYGVSLFSAGMSELSSALRIADRVGAQRTVTNFRRNLGQMV